MHTHYRRNRIIWSKKYLSQNRRREIELFKILPTDIIKEILYYLDTLSLKNCILNKRIAAICRDEYFRKTYKHIKWLKALH